MLAQRLINSPLVGVLLAAMAPAVLAQKPILFEDPRVYCTLSGAPGACADSHPQALAIADIMGTTANSAPDGLPDVVIVNQGDGSISVFRNKGDWGSPSGVGLERAATVASGTSGLLFDIELADIDGDSDLDALVTTTLSPSKLLTFLNQGNGVFAAPGVTNLSMTSSTGLTVADFDGDGDKDVFVAGGYTDGETFAYARVDRLLNDGTGVFAQQTIDFTDLGFASYGIDVVAANVNPPVGGRLDLLMPIAGGRMVVAYNSGDPDMDTWTYAIAPQAASCKGIVFGKLRPGDPRDVVLSIDGNNGIQLLLKDNSTPPNFDPVPDYIYSGGLTEPFGLDMGKLNPDQHNDIVLCMQHGSPPSGGEGHGGIVVWLGTGNGAFFTYPNTKSPVGFVVEPLGQNPTRHPKPCFVKIADMNDDGQNDVVTSNGDDSSMSVLINHSLSSIGL